MTKMVRIENADLGSKALIIEAWKPGTSGEPDTLLTATPLEQPTAMAIAYIYDNIYLVIRELKTNGQGGHGTAN